MMKRALSILAAALLLPSATSGAAGMERASAPQQQQDVWRPATTPRGGVSWAVLESTKEIARKGPDGYLRSKPVFTAQVQRLEGKRIRVAGWMDVFEPGRRQTHFLLMAYPPGCPFHFHAAPNQYIDNIRLMRTDLELRLRLTLPITGTTDQDLIPGNYRFSIWVKRDPNLGNNRFAANEVSLFARTATQFFQTVRSDATGWANWTSLSLDIPVAVLDAANPALELAIASTDRITANSSAAGSVLISAPSLQLCPSGFAAADCT